MVNDSQHQFRDRALAGISRLGRSWLWTDRVKFLDDVVGYVEARFQRNNAGFFAVEEKLDVLFLPDLLNCGKDSCLEFARSCCCRTLISAWESFSKRWFSRACCSICFCNWARPSSVNALPLS